MQTKKKYFNKILSLLIALMLVVVLLPTTAFASDWPGTPFANIDLSNVNTGEGNQAGWAKVEKLRTMFGVDRQYFLDENGAPIVDENGEGRAITLEAGKTYSLYLEWGSAVDNSGDLNEMFNITGGTLVAADALVANDEGYTLAMKYTFTVKGTSDKQPIGSVTLDGSSIVPVDGEAPKFLTIPEDAPYTAKQSWKDNPETWDNVTTFVAGPVGGCINYPIYLIQLYAKDGYTFTADDDINVTGIEWTNAYGDIDYHGARQTENGEYYLTFTGTYVIPTSEKKETKITSIKLTGISNKIAAGKSIQLKAAISPSNADNKALTWTSSNQKVAKVDQNGKVTMQKKSGGKSVTITVSATDGSGIKKSYKITSMKGIVKKISISGKKEVKANKALKLKAKVTASKGANKTLTWTSSNIKYAKVSSNGKVTALKAGKGKKVKITAAATDGSGKKKTISIKIK